MPSHRHPTQAGCRGHGEVEPGRAASASEIGPGPISIGPQYRRRGSASPRLTEGMARRAIASPGRLRTLTAAPGP